MIGIDEIERRLGFHPGTPETAPKYEANRRIAIGVADFWDRTLPPGRETALALTALQEALMWANAAVATNLAPLGPERVDGGARVVQFRPRLPGGEHHTGTLSLGGAGVAGGDIEATG